MAHPPLSSVGHQLRNAPLTTSWLAILFATTRIQRSASPRRRRRLLRRHSTNLRHLDTEPARVLASSLFWLDGRGWWPYLPAFFTVLAPAERRLGWWRWLVVGLTAHFVATYVGQDHLRRAIKSADAPRRLVDASDVGVSYSIPPTPGGPPDRARDRVGVCAVRAEPGRRALPLGRRRRTTICQA